MLFCLIKERDGVGWNKKRERERKEWKRLYRDIPVIKFCYTRKKKLTGKNGAVDVDERINKKKKKLRTSEGECEQERYC